MSEEWGDKYGSKVAGLLTVGAACSHIANKIRAGQRGRTAERAAVAAEQIVGADLFWCKGESSHWSGCPLRDSLIDESCQYLGGDTPSKGNEEQGQGGFEHGDNLF
jgi:hypothetical protein